MVYELPSVEGNEDDREQAEWKSRMLRISDGLVCSLFFRLLILLQFTRNFPTSRGFDVARGPGRLLPRVNFPVAPKFPGLPFIAIKLESLMQPWRELVSSRASRKIYRTRREISRPYLDSRNEATRDNKSQERKEQR